MATTGLSLPTGRREVGRHTRWKEVQGRTRREDWPPGNYEEGASVPPPQFGFHKSIAASYIS